MTVVDGAMGAVQGAMGRSRSHRLVSPRRSCTRRRCRRSHRNRRLASLVGIRVRIQEVDGAMAAVPATQEVEGARGRSRPRRSCTRQRCRQSHNNRRLASLTGNWGRRGAAEVVAAEQLELSVELNTPSVWASCT